MLKKRKIQYDKLFSKIDEYANALGNVQDAASIDTSTIKALIKEKIIYEDDHLVLTGIDRYAFMIVTKHDGQEDACVFHRNNEGKFEICDFLGLSSDEKQELYNKVTHQNWNPFMVDKFFGYPKMDSGSGYITVH